MKKTVYLTEYARAKKYIKLMTETYLIVDDYIDAFMVYREVYLRDHLTDRELFKIENQVQDIIENYYHA